MSDLPPTLLESEQKPIKPRDSAVAWKLVGAVFGAGGLVAGARARGFPEALLDPFGPLLVAIVALIGANVGALIGSLVFRFCQKRTRISVLKNSDHNLTSAQKGGEKALKQGSGALDGLNAWITVGGMIGAFGGWVYLATPPTERKGEYSMGLLMLPFLAIKAVFFLFQVIVFATAGALIGALVGSLIRIFRNGR